MTLYCHLVTDFDDWRHTARQMIAQGVAPADIEWKGADDGNASLFPPGRMLPTNSEKNRHNITVPPDFIALAKTVSCHSDPTKWALLYECLWRLVFENKKLLYITTDPLIRKLGLCVKNIKRDAHKAKAFIRFREYKEDDGTSHYVAWHQPDHHILPLVSGFFKRRFAVMKWTIMTPSCTAHWDGKTVRFFDGVPFYEHSSEDEMEKMWQSYYRATFNPARIKLKMMRTEMPTRYWHTMPETALIPSMLQEAEQRVDDMLALSAAQNIT